MNLCMSGCLKGIWLCGGRYLFGVSACIWVYMHTMYVRFGMHVSGCMCFVVSGMCLGV